MCHDKILNQQGVALLGSSYNDNHLTSARLSVYYTGQLYNELYQQLLMAATWTTLSCHAYIFIHCLMFNAFHYGLQKFGHTGCLYTNELQYLSKKVVERFDHT